MEGKRQVLLVVVHVTPRGSLLGLLHYVPNLNKGNNDINNNESDNDNNNDSFARKKKWLHFFYV
jgi:hypothetical protein